MEAFGLGPLPQGWEAKIEPKTGRIYFINHRAKNTTWEDPRLNMIPTPPYHIAITQPTAYFEDTGGSRWSSPVPSLRGFALNRRGSSPRLGGSPRIAPSPIPAPRNLRNEQQQVILGVSETEEKVGGGGGFSGTKLSSVETHHGKDEPTPGPSSRTRTSSIGNASGLLHNNNASVEQFLERPQSARSYASTTYSGHTVPSSFLSNCDPETGFRAVCALFPTAGEPHIRHLFHKYHNRATLVVSALQVEKHPFVSEVASQLELKLWKDGDDTDTIASIGETKSLGVHSPYKANSTTTTGSPARTGTPVSLLKFSNNPSSTGSIHTRWGSPMLSLSPQLQMVKEESLVQRSPKMKLKYLKGIFPAADETFLLDVLSSCENNVQRASDKMLKKGFTRTPPAKPARQKWLEVKLLIEKRNKALEQQRAVNELHISMGEPVESPFPTPIMKPARPHLSAEQKEKVKRDLIKRFSNLPDRFVSWAAEAAKFDVEKAASLLQEVGPETPDEFKPFVVSSPVNEAPSTFTANRDKDQGGGDAERRTVVRFAESPETMAQVVSSVMYGTSSGGSSLSLRKWDDVQSSLDIDTPDSGYFELEKTRKKSFISTIFGIKQDKEKDYVANSQVAKGPNSSYVKGPNPYLLQPNYIPARGPSSVSKGPNANNRVASSGNANGPNPSLAKGSVWGKNSPGNQHRIHHVAVQGF